MSKTYFSPEEKQLLRRKELSVREILKFPGFNCKFNSIDDIFNSVWTKIRKSRDNNRINLLEQILKYSNNFPVEIKQKILIHSEAIKVYNHVTFNFLSSKLPRIGHKHPILSTQELTDAHTRVEYIDFYLQNKPTFDQYFAADFFNDFFFQDPEIRDVFTLKTDPELSGIVLTDSIYIDLKPIVEKIVGYKLHPKSIVCIFVPELVDIPITKKHFMELILPETLDFFRTEYNIYLFPEILKEIKNVMNNFLVSDLTGIVLKYIKPESVYDPPIFRYDSEPRLTLDKLIPKRTRKF